ncbi:2-acylglycerol O-acyltransferase 2-A-like isoform X2 [Daktulosphaira vitifoliae]|nr:2-acylglycerol O-acyltransferase 2-A-like isoform X2 [Daktulosphaira vitifoliae]XP_050523970.1 2-acylglycerol O-acyltransferase 2-A-like isoform X2 [Daktulosphaira vitifoliae]
MNSLFLTSIFKRGIENISAAIAVYLFLFCGFLETALVVFFTCYYAPQFFWVSPLYIGWILYENKYTCPEKLRFNFVRYCLIWKHFKDYFPMMLVKTYDLPADKTYLFVVHPHGLLGWGQFSNLITCVGPFRKIFPGINTYLHVLGVHFCIPFHREVLMSHGLRDSSERTISKILNGKKGNASVLLVGGVVEAFKSYPGPITIVINNRKGFVRIALKTGASLVPVFSFGENNVYKKQVLETDSFLYKFLKLIGWKGDRVIPQGRSLFGIRLSFMPHRHPIISVVGKPIDLPKIENPSNEETDKYHKIYKEELTKLFEQHKHKYTKNQEELTLNFE